MLDWSNPAKKYLEMAREFIKLMGIKDGSIPIIKRAEHPQQWRDWYAYYGFRNLPFHRELLREKQEKTVPTLSPFDFDPEFSLGYPAPDVPRGADEKPFVQATLEQKMRSQRFLAESRLPPMKDAAE